MKKLLISRSLSLKKGFSLIELSIVLIIIGLLVAGVTGGASLIQSAKIRGLINEIRNHEQNMYIFYSTKDRLPGDLNGDGKIGYSSGESYAAENFSSPYNEDGSIYNIPDVYSAPFVELYQEKITDFQPKKRSSDGTAFSAAKNGGIPLSRVFPDYFIFVYHFDGKNTNQISADYQANGNFLRYENYSHFNDAESDRRLLPAKLVKQIDEKLDDGVYNSGKLRGGCYGTMGGRGQNSYDNAIQNKKSCDAFNYKMP